MARRKKIKLLPKAQSPTEKAVDDCLRKIQQYYYAEVRDYARQVQEAFNDGELDSEDQVTEYIDQMIDGSGLVIYTKQNYFVLLGSNADPAEAAEEAGFESLSLEGHPSWHMQLAYSLLLHDVREDLGDYSDWFD